MVTTAGGSRLATSVGGVLTGRGGDLIIIDDPLKASDALSDSKREAVNDWFDASVLSRLNDKRNGQIMLVMQRLHEHDLTGHVLGRSNWDVVRFPAIAEEDEEHDYCTPWGPRVFTRREGDVLQPERESREILENLRQELGTYNFASQYQQSPIPPGGGLIKIHWFKHYEPDQLSIKFDRIVQSWDTANKVSELSNCSVCTTWGILNSNFFLLHVLRKRLEFPDLKRAVKEQQQVFSVDVVLIEDQASGTQLIQDLLREGFYYVTGYVPSGDKVMRMHAQTALIENGSVYLPTSAYWLDEYLRELAAFPQGRYDDQVDSTSQFLGWYKKPMRNWGIYELYRQRSERATAERESMVTSRPRDRHLHKKPIFDVGSMTATTLAIMRSKLF